MQTTVERRVHRNQMGQGFDRQHLGERLVKEQEWSSISDLHFFLLMLLGQCYQRRTEFRDIWCGDLTLELWRVCGSREHRPK